MFALFLAACAPSSTSPGQAGPVAPADVCAAAEVCNDADDDCDGLVDEGFDADGDGWRTCRGDCDDAEPLVTPVAAEVCDGLDNDCDPATDEALDRDGDGFSTCAGDCDEASPDAHPGGLEVCDGLDNDCDGVADPFPECWACVEAAGTYLACATPVPWTEAAAACAALGAHLAVTADSADAAAVGDIGRDLLGGEAWIGLTDRATEGTWLWEDGTAPTWLPWWEGEPNGVGDEDCVATGFGEWGRWNDFDCGTGLAFVCELG